MINKHVKKILVALIHKESTNNNKVDDTEFDRDKEEGWALLWSVACKWAQLPGARGILRHHQEHPKVHRQSHKEPHL